jgi:hypothetical protein
MSVRRLSTFVSCVALCVVPASASPDGERAPDPDDELVGLLLDAAGERAAALEDAVAMRGAAGIDAIQRARDGREPQRAWLAEAYAIRIGERAAPLRARADAIGRPVLRTSGFDPASVITSADLLEQRGAGPNMVLRVMRGFVSPLPGGGPAKPATPEQRAAAALALLGQGEGRAIGWIERFADDPFVQPQTRLDCVSALLAARVPGAVGRLDRIVGEMPGTGVPLSLLPAAAGTGWAEAVPFVMRARGFESPFPKDDDTANAARLALETLAQVPGYAEAYEASLVPIRTYEAEDPDAAHATGFPSAIGWSVEKGRPGSEPNKYVVHRQYATGLPDVPLVARFRWRLDAVADRHREKHLLDLEVSSVEMEKAGVHMLQVGIGPETAPEGQWQQTDVWFRPHPAPARMEFRVRWGGGCDATVDRVEILRVRPISDAEIAAWPPRAMDPYRPRGRRRLTEQATAALIGVTAKFALAEPPADGERWAVQRIRASNAQILAAAAVGLPVDQGPEAYLPPSGRWTHLRALLLEEPNAERVLLAVAADRSDPQRAWLADAWLERLRHRVAWEDGELVLDALMERLLAARTDGDETARLAESELARGLTAFPTPGIAPRPLPARFRWADGILLDREPKPAPDAPRPATPRPTPADAPWRAIFAERWLTGRPGPLPPVWVQRSGISEPVDSSLGPLRLHALVQTAWLGDVRARPALEAVAATPSATAAEKHAARQALLNLKR